MREALEFDDDRGWHSLLGGRSSPGPRTAGYIAVPKETAFKAVVLGEFPEISFKVTK